MHLDSAASVRSLLLYSFHSHHQILHFSLHDALPISLAPGDGEDGFLGPADLAHLHLAADLVVLSGCRTAGGEETDRKSTRLNSSHGYISYAVFCLKKKTQPTTFNFHEDELNIFAYQL